MIKAVGDVESEFRVDAVVIRALLHSPFDIDDEIAGGTFFARDRLTAETDDVGGAVFTEKFAIVLRDARVIRQQQGDLLPDGSGTDGFKPGGKFSGQPADCRQIDPAFLPVYQRGFHF